MFSILLPTRNRLGLLRHAIRSVIEQDFDEFEIVISDNASDEDYAGLIDELTDPRIKYLRSSQVLSVTDNWNRALDHATQHYVLMLGDDDALAPGLLKELRQTIEKEGQPDVVYIMAYHYLYPGVIPEVPAGSLSSVANSELFDCVSASYRLNKDRAKSLAKDAVSFRHRVSFNAQHFVWKRDFSRSSVPFFRPPYPDYFACFFSFLKAESIVVVPRPSIIIGIAQQSFGAFFMTNRQEEGHAAFANDSMAQMGASVYDEHVREALRFPGTIHYRNWLLTSLLFQREIDNDVTLDLDLYKKVQILETLAETLVSNPSATTFQQRWPGFEEIALEFWKDLRGDAEMDGQAVCNVAQRKVGMLHALGVYFPAKVEAIVLDKHDNIYDAFLALLGTAAPTGETSSSHLVSEETPCTPRLVKPRGWWRKLKSWKMIFSHWRLKHRS